MAQQAVTAMSWKDYLHQRAEQLGMPLRTAEQVRACLHQAKKNGADKSMARLMLRAGRLTDEAREVAQKWLGG